MKSSQGGKEQGESYAANIRSPLLMMSNGAAHPALAIPADLRERARSGLLGRRTSRPAGRG